MMAGRVVMIGKETTIERLSEATNQPIWAQAQIPPDTKAGTTTESREPSGQRRFREANQQLEKADSDTLVYRR